jgi:multidrug efflux pump subunit AcrA (membrane-fusion protein)
VDRPYDKVVPGERPPLVKGMYCAVELRGRKPRQQLVIPRSALHGDRHGEVFVLDADNRLHRRAVVVAYAQSGFACIRSGLTAGEVIVVSDPMPAIPADPTRGQRGMLVTPVDDPELTARILAEARAEVELR